MTAHIFDAVSDVYERIKSVKGVNELNPDLENIYASGQVKVYSEDFSQVTSMNGIGVGVPFLALVQGFYTNPALDENGVLDMNKVNRFHFEGHVIDMSLKYMAFYRGPLFDLIATIITLRTATDRG